MTLPDRTTILELAGTLASARPDTRHEDMQRAAQVIRDQLGEIDDLRGQLAAEQASAHALAEAAVFAVEIIKDSWGDDQIDAGDDQACNALIYAIDRHNQLRKDG